MEPGRGWGDQLIAAGLQEVASVRFGIGAVPAARTHGEMSLDRRALVSGRFTVDIGRQERFEVLTILHLIPDVPVTYH
jgi:hypothetical protein